MYFCIPELDIDSGGLKILERDADVLALYELARKHKKVNLFVAHTPQNLAPYYHHNLSLDSSDSEVTSKRKHHEKLKKDAGNMSYDELVAWAEEEAQSPYLRSPPPVKDRPLRKDFEGKVTFTRLWNYQDELAHDIPLLSDDEVYKSPEKVADNVGDNTEMVDRDVENRVPTHEVVDEVIQNMAATDEVVDVGIQNSAATDDVVEDRVETNQDIDEVMLARQKKLDKGKAVITTTYKPSSQKTNNIRRPTGITIRENNNPVSSDSDSEQNMDKCHNQTSDYESYDSDCESEKSYDYLSNCEDEVIELRKRISQRKHNIPADLDGEQGSDENDDDTPEVVDGFTYTGLASLVRQHESYMDSLMRQLKGNGVGISDPFSIDLKSKKDDNYPVHDEETHWRLKKPKVRLLTSCYY